MAAILDCTALWLAAIFLAVAVGFGWGRRHGRRDGFVEGARYAPLQLRQLSLEKGQCAICRRGPDEAEDKFVENFLDTGGDEPV